MDEDFIIVKKSDLLEIFRESEYIKTFDDDFENIPIKKDMYITDLDIKDIDYYVKLLHVFAYFGMGMTEKMKKYHYDIKNRDLILSRIYPFIDTTYFKILIDELNGYNSDSLVLVKLINNSDINNIQTLLYITYTSNISNFSNKFKLSLNDLESIVKNKNFTYKNRGVLTSFEESLYIDENEIKYTLDLRHGMFDINNITTTTIIHKYDKQYDIIMNKIEYFYNKIICIRDKIKNGETVIFSDMEYDFVNTAKLDDSKFIYTSIDFFTYTKDKHKEIYGNDKRRKFDMIKRWHENDNVVVWI